MSRLDDPGQSAGGDKGHPVAEQTRAGQALHDLDKIAVAGDTFDSHPQARSQLARLTTCATLNGDGQASADCSTRCWTQTPRALTLRGDRTQPLRHRLPQGLMSACRRGGQKAKVCGH